MKLLTPLYILFRQIGTAFIFSAISGGGFLLSILLFPLIGLCSRTQETKSRRVQYALHLTFKLVTTLMRILCLVKIRKENWERINTKEGMLIISNHPTLIDYVYLTSLFPQLDCVVKPGLWNNFFLKGVVRAAGYIKVEDPVSFRQECLNRLDNGRVLLIFPEGTRSNPDSLKPFKKGAASLIASSTCKVQILTIKCILPILMKNQKWYEIPPKMANLHISAHEPFDRKIASDGEEKLIKAQTNINKYLWNYINSYI